MVRSLSPSSAAAGPFTAPARNSIGRPRRNSGMGARNRIFPSSAKPTNLPQSRCKSRRDDYRGATKIQISKASYWRYAESVLDHAARNLALAHDDGIGLKSQQIFHFVVGMSPRHNLQPG